MCVTTPKIKLEVLLVICLVGKLDEVYRMLADANPNMVVYRKDDIPEHFHYQHSVRIMPILLEAKEGWTIMQNRTGLFMRMSENTIKLCFQAICRLIVGGSSFLKSIFLTAALIWANYSFIGDLFLSLIRS